MNKTLSLSSGAETERKFLIAFPSAEELKNASVSEIEQTYIDTPSGSLRIRKVLSEGVTAYIECEKKKLTDLTRAEKERFLTAEEYASLLPFASAPTIKKTRFSYLYRGHVLEIDIFPFAKETALLEIELTAEGEKYELPPFIKVVREVSTEREFENSYIAKNYRKFVSGDTELR